VQRALIVFTAISTSGCVQQHAKSDSLSTCQHAAKYESPLQAQSNDNDDVATYEGGDDRSTQAGAFPLSRSASEALIRQVGDFYRDLQAFGVDSRITTKVAVQGQNRGTVLASRRVLFERPMRFAFVSRDPTHFSSYSNGTLLWTVLESRREYSERSLPASIDALLDSPYAAVPGGPAGSFALHLASEDPTTAMLRDVIEISHAGVVLLDGQETNRLDLLQTIRGGQERVRWSVWVATDGDPLVLQIRISATSRRRVPGQGERTISQTTTEHLRGWDLNPTIDDRDLVPPQGFARVDTPSAQSSATSHELHRSRLRARKQKDRREEPASRDGPGP
jgi:hypothetical protein